MTRRLALVIGAAGSLTLTLMAGRSNPSRVLLILFGGWVLSPFLALGLAAARTRTRPILPDRALDALIGGVSLGSLVVYSLAEFRMLPGPRAAPFLLAPLAAWALIGGAWLLARIRGRGGQS